MLFFQIQHINENEALGLKSRVFPFFLLSNGELVTCLREKWEIPGGHESPLGPSAPWEHESMPSLPFWNRRLQDNPPRHVKYVCWTYQTALQHAGLGPSSHRPSGCSSQSRHLCTWRRPEIARPGLDAQHRPQCQQPDRRVRFCSWLGVLNALRISRTTIFPGFLGRVPVYAYVPAKLIKCLFRSENC